MSRVLVVDDDPGIRLLMDAWLRRNGYDPLVAATAADALAAFAREPVDVVISDLVMPETDGLALLIELKRQRPELPVIMMTGKGSVEAAVSCIRAGATDFLSKPVDLPRLGELLETAQRPLAAGAPQVLASRDPHWRQLGPYELEKVLGYGSFSVVYLARDGTRGGSHVALKVLRSGTVGGTDHPAGPEAMFSAEAAAILGLTHPHVVRVYDYGVEPRMGLAYVSMEYLPGQTLRSLLPEMAERDVAAKLTLLRQLAEGLAALQAVGVCHRDVKPANVMVGSDGQVKLMDIGLTSFGNEPPPSGAQLLGTLCYAAPELFSTPERADARSDLFSLGVLAYELLLGQRPFAGDTPAAICHTVTHRRPPAPRRLNPELSVDVELVLARLLKKNPASRYNSARELLRDLDALAGKPRTGLALRAFIRTRVLARDWS